MSLKILLVDDHEVVRMRLKTNKEIAADIFLSAKTVRNYVSSILSKLHLSRRSEAAVYAVQHRIQDHLPTD